MDPVVGAPSTPHSPGIFLSYRRSDAEFATLEIYPRLTRAFGEDAVFLDHEKLWAGDPLRGSLRDAVRDCQVLVALIGHGWLDASDGAGARRLDDPDDYVRMEIATAYAHRRPVVGVLLSGAELPGAAQVPADLAPLAEAVALELRAKDVDGDAARIVRHLRRFVTDRRPPWRRLADRWRGRTGRAVLAAALVLSVLVAALVARAVAHRGEQAPTVMGADVNVAVSPFTTGAADAELRGLADGIVSGLPSATTSGFSVAGRVLDDRTPVSGRGARDRAVEARRAAAVVNAQVVVYATTSAEQVQPWFVLAPSMVRDAAELVGPYELGAPFDATGLRFVETRGPLRQALTARVGELLRLTDGLAQLRLGRFAEALATFSGIDRDAAPFEPALADLFAGTAALGARDLDDATRWYRQALDRRPAYDRALLGIAEVTRQRALATAGCRAGSAPVPTDELAEIDAAFAAVARAAASPFVPERLSLARATHALCLATRQGAAAATAVAHADAILDPQPDKPDDPTMRRLVAQALLVRGAARTVQHRWSEAADDDARAAALTAPADSGVRALARWSEAQAHAARQRWTEAARAYEAALTAIDQQTTPDDIRVDRSQIACELTRVKASQPPRGDGSPCGA